MSGGRIKEAQRDFDNAQRAGELQNSWLMTFQGACQRGDWDAADEAQACALAAFDSYLTHSAAGYKRMESA